MYLFGGAHNTACGILGSILGFPFSGIYHAYERWWLCALECATLTHHPAWMVPQVIAHIIDSTSRKLVDAQENMNMHEFERFPEIPVLIGDTALGYPAECVRALKVT